MLVLVTLLGHVPVMGKYEQIVVFGFVLCWRKWRKLRDAVVIGSPCLRSVTSIVVDSPMALFFSVSRKRVNARAWRKTVAWLL